MAGARVITLTLNPALDITVSIDQLTPESTLRIPHAQRRLGGKGLNVANVAAEQGYPALALAPLNELSLAELKARVAASSPGVCPLHEQVQLLQASTPVPLRSTYALVETESSTTTIINESGQEHPAEVYRELLKHLADSLAQYPGSVVTLSGSFPPRSPEGLISDIARTCQEAGAAFIVDTSGPYLLEAARAGVTYLKPNRAELVEATGEQDLYRGVARLQELGAQQIIVSCGPDGLYAFGQEQGVKARLAHPLEGNPTGAGDALVAALATSLLDELSLEDLLIRAVSWSASAVTQPLAGSIGSAWSSLAEKVIVEDVTYPSAS
ncbi:1-phosphofructokinase family hexose kinase [Rothia sp. CCM 9417]|uniref:1-phosphofructokinase family hexose kinase n=1 Tax=Rothia sp. CCM 9417 TaxID=3402657 RepID=UPI003ADAC411